MEVVKYFNFLMRYVQCDKYFVRLSSNTGKANLRYLCKVAMTYFMNVKRQHFR